MTQDAVAEEKNAECEGDQCEDRHQAREAAWGESRPLAHGGDRRYARGAEGRSQARHQRDHDSHEEAHDDRAGREDGSGSRQVEADHLEERVEAFGEAEPEEEADDRAEGADDERLDHDRLQDLTARRA